MSNSTLEVINIVPVAEACKKCGAAEKHPSGACKACARVSGAAWREANKDQKKATALAWNLANKDRKKATDAAWYAANAETKNAKVAARRAANPERHKACNAAYSEKNQKEIASRNAVWRSENPERVRAWSAKWAKANPDSARLRRQARRAREANSGGKLTKGLTDKLFTLQKGTCPCCNQPLGNDYHLDHIMPLALGGLNVDGNIQLLRAICNQQKHAAHPVDFMQSRGFLI